MRKLILRIFLILSVAIIAYASPVSAASIPIDLTDFSLSDSDGTAIVTSDSAALNEDDLLINDPFYDEPGILVPANLDSFRFSYDFTAASDGMTDFYMWLFDGDSGDEIAYWYISANSVGNIQADLSGLNPSITLLGLEFGLDVYDGDSDGDGTIDDTPGLFNATVSISNVRLVTEDIIGPIPEPSTLLLLGLGFLGLAGLGRKKTGS